MAYPTNHEHLRGDPLRSFLVRCKRKHALLYSIEDLQSAILSMVKQVQQAKSRLEKASKNFQSIYAPFVQSGTALPNEVDPCIASGPGIRPFSMLTEEMGASGTISAQKRAAAAAVECCLVHAHRERRFSVSKGIDHLTRKLH